MKTPIIPALLLSLLPVWGAENPTASAPQSPEQQRQQEQREEQEMDPFSSFDTDFQPSQRPGVWRQSSTITSAQIRMEWIETSTKDAVLALDQWTAKADASSLRKGLMKLENTLMLEALLNQLDVGEKTSSESIFEMIYPTEYNGPELPPLAKDQLNPKPTNDIFSDYLKLLQQTGLMPVAFETRNTGTSVDLALEPVTKQPGSFDLRIVPEKVQYHGMQNHGEKGIEAQMPLFSTVRTRITLRLTSGQWRLAAMQASIDPATGQPTPSRRLLLFVRLDLIK